MPIRHRYLFHLGQGPDSQIITGIETDIPMSHIQVGHRLSLETDDFSMIAGTELVIVEVRIVASFFKTTFVRYDVHVHCRREPIIGS